MHRFTSIRAAIAMCLAIALGAGATACGSDSASSGKDGGTVKIATAAFPVLDPALSYSVEDWQALTQVYPGLLVFRHESGPEGAKVAPGLAERLPAVSADGKTYRLRLRPNLRFSDGSPLRASDFKASIERIIASDSPGLSLGYPNIVGAEEYAETKRGGIRGIEVSDATGDITIRLVEPRGAFTYELAIPFAGVVPKRTLPQNQTKNPPPGAGRYVIDDVRLNRSFRLRRNTNFSIALERTAVDAGKVDGFDVTVASVPNAATLVSQNRADFMVDNPPGDRVGEIQGRYEDRYRQFGTPSVFWFFMNTEAEPFDDLRVRQAVNHAIEPEALQRLQGGLLEPGHTILPRGVPGFEKSSDLYPFDREKARQLIRAAGAEGAEVTVWGTPEDPAKATVEYYADVLNQIGLKAKPKIISDETYIETIGKRAVKAQTGWASFQQDYPHPADFLDVLLNPGNVRADGNSNFAYNASDRQLGTQIDALAGRQLTPATEKQWAAIDRAVQRKAYWAPYGTRRQSTFFSERMDFENCKGDDWPVASHDWAQFCLK